MKASTKYYLIVMGILPFSLAWSLFAPHTPYDWVYWLGMVPMATTQLIFIVKYFHAVKNQWEKSDD